MAGRLHLAPGASGSLATLAPHATGLAARGIAVELVALPRGAATRSVVAYRAAVDDEPRPIIGGHSFGGRVASLLAAERPLAGLVALSYPLHPPGRTERWEERTAHWPQITCPVLLLSGEADPFARIDIMRDAVALLPTAELVTYPCLRHGLGPVLDDVLDRIAAFVQGVGVLRS